MVTVIKKNICSGCNRKISDDCNYCPHCGTRHPDKPMVKRYSVSTINAKRQSVRMEPLPTGKLLVRNSDLQLLENQKKEYDGLVARYGGTLSESCPYAYPQPNPNRTIKIEYETIQTDEDCASFWKDKLNELPKWLRIVVSILGYILGLAYFLIPLTIPCYFFIDPPGVVSVIVNTLIYLFFLAAFSVPAIVSFSVITDITD